MFNCIWEDYLGVPTCTLWYYYGEIILLLWVTFQLISIATEKCMSDKRMYYVAWNILGLKTLL